jgi:hypothetical protein
VSSSVLVIILMTATEPCLHAFSPFLATEALPSEAVTAEAVASEAVCGSTECVLLRAAFSEHRCLRDDDLRRGASAVEAEDDPDSREDASSAAKIVRCCNT